jgi:hypothetical protein
VGGLSSSRNASSFIGAEHLAPAVSASNTAEAAGGSRCENYRSIEFMPVSSVRNFPLTAPASDYVKGERSNKMERIDLASVIQETVSTFCRNRIGDKPPVFLTFSPALTEMPWKNRPLKDLSAA